MKGEKTGIGWCAENILQNIEHKESNSYQINCFTLGYSKKQLNSVEKYKASGYKVKKCSWFHDVIYRIVSSFINIPYSIFFGSSSEITIFFNYVIPPGVKGKKVAFIYDMAYKAYPETVRKKTRNLLNLALKNLASVRIR
jgi:hypothetical protein